VTGYGTNAIIESAVALTLDANDNIVIADKRNCHVRMISAATGLVSTIAGTTCMVRCTFQCFTNFLSRFRQFCLYVYIFADFGSV
jgi:hypothetical protein